MLLFLAAAAAGRSESLVYPPFGNVEIYRPVDPPSALVLLVSGDGGWKLGVVGMAIEISSEGAMVAGIDIKRYLKAVSASDLKCANFATDLAALGSFVQDKCGVRPHFRPLLMGYSSGATLVYAALAQSEPHTFLGAISLGFCADFQMSKEICKGRGLESVAGPNGRGVLFLPAKSLQDPWVALQGTVDQVCFANSTESYAKQVPNGQIILLPKVGHGYGVEKNWLPQFKEVFRRITGNCPSDP